MDAEAADVLAFWFGAPGSPEHGKPRRAWFAKDAAFDEESGRRFRALHACAALGERDRWDASPRELLALLVVLDQFSRNLYRGDARAFSQDGAALAAARRMIDRGWDRDLLPVERQFAYLPFEHAESMAEQDRAVALFTDLEAFEATKGLVVWAEKHRDVIRRFGRFPHRNAALGRESTPAEIEYLAQPGAGF